MQSRRIIPETRECHGTCRHRARDGRHRKESGCDTRKIADPLRSHTLLAIVCAGFLADSVLWVDPQICHASVALLKCLLSNPYRSERGRCCSREVSCSQLSERQANRRLHFLGSDPQLYPCLILAVSSSTAFVTETSVSTTSLETCPNFVL